MEIVREAIRLQMTLGVTHLQQVEMAPESFGLSAAARGPLRKLRIRRNRALHSSPVTSEGTDDKPSEAAFDEEVDKEYDRDYQRRVNQLACALDSKQLPMLADIVDSQYFELGPWLQACDDALDAFDAGLDSATQVPAQFRVEDTV